MLTWAILFLVISLVAGLLGFSGISATFGFLAKIIFGVFLVLFIITLIMGFLIV